ncbi:hypothetical protein E4K10_46265 [Streptomyces sp. T1317-0309]|nr:hypothetical protein E4K10_46265 [Streptomyces sp. T1317-0309]
MPDFDEYLANRPALRRQRSSTYRKSTCPPTLRTRSIRSRHTSSSPTTRHGLVALLNDIFSAEKERASGYWHNAVLRVVTAPRPAERCCATSQTCPARSPPPHRLAVVG